LRALEFRQENDQVLQRAAQSVDRPCHDQVELPLSGVSAQLVELRALVLALGAADAVITVDVDNFAAHPPGNLAQLPLLVGGGLV
jgi:hypothetical protein